MHLYLITGLLLYLAEPPFGLWPLAFVALIPAMHAAHRARTYRSAVLGGFLAGVAFFATINCGLLASRAMGSKSFTTSY